MWSILFSILCLFLLAFFGKCESACHPCFSCIKYQKVLIFQRVQGIVTTVYCFDVTPKWNSFEITRNQFEGNLTRVRIPPAAPENLFCLFRQKRFFYHGGARKWSSTARSRRPAVRVRIWTTSVAAPESKDYRTRLDAYAFHEGFAHLLSYQAAEIDCVDRHRPQLTETAAASCTVHSRRRTPTGKSSSLKMRSAARTMRNLPVCAVCCIWPVNGKRTASTASRPRLQTITASPERPWIHRPDDKEEETRSRLFLFVLHLFPLLPPEIDRQQDCGVDQRGGENDERKVALHLIARGREALDE